MNEGLPELDPQMAVEVLYRAMLGRGADPEGLAVFVKELKNGLSLNQIFDILRASPEYALRYPTQSGDGQFSMKLCTVNELQLHLPVNDWVYSNVINGLEQSYEPHVVAVMRRLLRTGDIFLDVGANVGVHSCLGSQLVGEKGLVIAVEASLANAMVLKKNADEAPIQNIVIFPSPASNEVEILTFSDVTDCSNQYIIDDRRAGPAALLQTPTIRQIGVPLDLILGRMRRINLIKIDVEGHELSALKGLEKSIRESARPPIIAEYTKSAASEGYAALLFSMGYGARIIDATGKLGDNLKSVSDVESGFVPLTPEARHCDILFSTAGSPA